MNPYISIVRDVCQELVNPPFTFNIAPRQGIADIKVTITQGSHNTLLYFSFVHRPEVAVVSDIHELNVEGHAIATPSKFARKWVKLVLTVMSAQRVQP